MFSNYDLTSMSYNFYFTAFSCPSSTFAHPHVAYLGRLGLGLGRHGLGRRGLGRRGLGRLGLGFCESKIAPPLCELDLYWCVIFK